MRNSRCFLPQAPKSARRRHKQLIEKGETATLAELIEAVNERDERDKNRQTAPLRPAADALRLDSTGQTIDEVVAAILAVAKERLAL